MKKFFIIPVIVLGIFTAGHAKTNYMAQNIDLGLILDSLVNGGFGIAGGIEIRLIPLMTVKTTIGYYSYKNDFSETSGFVFLGEMRFYPMKTSLEGLFISTGLVTTAVFGTPLSYLVLGIPILAGYKFIFPKLGDLFLEPVIGYYVFLGEANSSLSGLAWSLNIGAKF